MNSYKVDATSFSPRIEFDTQNHIFCVEGFSRQENVRTFYQDFFDWFEKNKAEIMMSITPSTKLKVKLKIIYFNSASLKCLIDLLLSVKRLYSSINKDNHYDMEIVWYYDEDDDDMLEAGQDFSEVLEMPFIYKKYKS